MFEGFKNFFARPYDEDMNAFDWFLLVGLLMIFMIFWGLILRHIQAGISD